MSTSTQSKSMDKLYSVLKGYEIASYTGKELGTIQKSAQNLISQELSYMDLPDEVKHDIEMIYIKLVHSYLESFYRRMRNLHDAAETLQLAEDAKHDYDLLLSLSSRFLDQELSFCSLCPVSNTNLEAKPITITENQCPYYFPTRSYFCSMTLDDIIYDEGFRQLSIKFNLKESKKLALLMTKVGAMCFPYCKDDRGFYNLEKFLPILHACVTYAQAFKQMNPTGKIRLEMLAKAKDLITNPSVNYNDPEYPYLDSILTRVFQDVEEDKLPYIHELKKSVDKCRQIFSEGYKEDYYYFSVRSTGQKLTTKEGCSLLSSLDEIDWHKLDSRVKNYDLEVGYTSGYKEIPDDFQGDPPSCVIILGINNPNKFKIRIIHIGDNPLQDRCNMLHYCTQEGLKVNRCDSSDNHDKGRNIVRRWTTEWLLQSEEERQAIVGTDFSNATDTLDQRFCYRILEFIFGKSVADFWDYCSKLVKTIDYRSSLVMSVSSKSEKKRILNLSDTEFLTEFGVPPTELVAQTNGQPQGMLFGFEDFSLSHHFILAAAILMLEDSLGGDISKDPTQCDPTEVYVLIGDDNDSRSIYPEKYYIDNGWYELTPNGEVITLFHVHYFTLCNKLAGWEINYDKCTFCHYNSPFAEVDLASVKVRNGRFFTPLPFRHVSNLTGTIDSALTIVVWLLDRKMDLEERADLILQYWLNKLPGETRKLYEELCYNHYYPYLDSLAEFNYISPFNKLEQGVLNFCVLQSFIEASVLRPMLNDHLKTMTSNELWEYALRRFSKDKWKAVDKKLNDLPNHKLNYIIVKNHDILDMIKQIQLFDNIDEKVIAASFSRLIPEEKKNYFDLLLDYLEQKKFLEVFSGKEDLKPFYQFIDFSSINNVNTRKGLQSFAQNFLIRGTTKRPPVEVQIFRDTIDLWNLYKDSVLLSSLRS